jgi:hypothetical protein
MAHTEALPQAIQFPFTGGAVEGSEATHQALQPLYIARSPRGLHHKAWEKGAQQHPSGIGLQMEREPFNGKR